MDSVQLAEALSAARRVVDQSRKLILSHVDRGISRTLKEDQSWVTEADVAVEELIREFLGNEFSDHGIIGEEFPAVNAEADYQWVIDPIDGTQNFAHGIPTYGTILALQYNGESIIGIVDHPALEKCYYASKGQGAFYNGKKLQIVDCTNPPHPLEVVCLAPRLNFERTGEGELFDLIVKAHPSQRVYYDIWPTSLAAQGSLAASIEYNVRLWDVCANQILVEEAGGAYQLLAHYTDEEGLERYSTICGKPAMVSYLLGLIEDFQR